ncbi:endonuclease V [Flavobacterium columnare]|uniref:Deoxyinosine 3'endonuclease (Endonuclease V)-like protein n=3 Tax=Flavobacterium columnare TaxID=996 RepID=G8X8D4_FLACA|nr:endonuclease V [Flavobacterium columnare]AEW85768.1 deoxyinosine 3'endonuclease (endonuclease V)-like protein [Flavobacterium columnare ATCC 49512]AMO21355.1 endonuclease V [Flavobacterium columnare]APT21557.1 endonuclease V [Flavobacterium columnare]AUX19399.1 endonuclease V [Flavobacterium columnare]MBF6652235.1 endonuclease V [Flavobacterium columnare]
MILAIDVYYVNNTAKSVGVLFNWEDTEPTEIIIDTKEGIEEYVPGEFYKRELPCIEALLKKIPLEKIEIIIIDGHIYVDDSLKYGLGGYVWELLDKKIPIIGVAKNAFHSNKSTVEPIYRGESKKPLYVSAIGIEIATAVIHLQNMYGDFRIPSILKELDTITKIQDYKK